MFFEELLRLGLMILFFLSWKDGQRAGMRKTFSANRNQFARDQAPSRQLSAATLAAPLAEGPRTCARASSRRFTDSTKAFNHLLIVYRRSCKLFPVASRISLIQVAI